MTASAELARGSLIRVRNDQCRCRTATAAGREVVEHPGAVAIVALDDDRPGAADPPVPAPGRAPALGDPGRPAGRRRRAAAGHRGPGTGRGDRLPGGRAGSQLADIYTSPGISNERIRVFLARTWSRARRAAGLRPRARGGQHGRAPGCRWMPRLPRFMAGDLHNGVTALGILSAYAALGHAERDRCARVSRAREADGTGQPGHPARGRMAGNGARRSWRWRKDGQP